MSSTPNILIFFTDDQRFDTIAALGNPHIHTPNLDRFVQRGCTCSHAHIPGGSSGAVCMPSRAMLHTGRSLFHLQGEGQEIPAEHTLLGEYFRHAGYQSFGTGKWHNGTSAYARSFSCGAEIFFGGMEDHWNVPACHFDPSGTYAQQKPFIRQPQRERHVRQRLCDHIRPGVHSTDLFTAAGGDFLRDRDPERPFFAYVSLMAPHDPRSMPAEFLNLYDPSRLPLPPNFRPEHPIDTGALRIRDEMLARHPREPDDIRQHLAEYYAMISHLDDAFGRLLSQLEKSDVLDNTIVVVAGDNGLALGQHGLMGKQSLYDHSVRVPLILAGPGIVPDSHCDDLLYLFDLFPTLCELSGMPIPESVEGHSFAAALRGESQQTVREYLYLAYCDSIRGISDGRRKLIEYACGASQFFDLEADPWETDNRVEDPIQTEHVAAFRQRMADGAEEWDDRQHPLGAAFWSSRADLPSVEQARLRPEPMKG